MTVAFRSAKLRLVMDTMPIHYMPATMKVLILLLVMKNMILNNFVKINYLLNVFWYSVYNSCTLGFSYSCRFK